MAPGLRSFGRIALWILYLGALGGLAEVATRLLELVPPYTPQPDRAIKLYYEAPNGLVLLRPGALYFTNGNIPMVINTNGFRDRLYHQPKKPGVTRVAIVGDSFTMGDGVVVDETYPDQLEALFAEEAQEVEVLNFGITATNTLQQLELVRETVLQSAPDVLILGFNLNDYKIYEQTSFDRARQAFGVTYRVNTDRTVDVVQPSRTRLEQVKNALTTRSALVRLAVSARDALGRSPAGGAAGNAVTAALLTDRDIPEANWSRVNLAVADMAEIARSGQARFLVILLPAMTELQAPYPASFEEYPYGALHQRIGAFLQSEGIDFIDVLPHFDGLAIRPMIVSRFDPHFSQAGNAVIARALHDVLLDREMIGPTNQ